MSSYDDGKQEVVEYIRKNFRKGSTCLDVGACDGKWYDLLGDWLVMDAVEIFIPNIVGHDLCYKYRGVYGGDIANYSYEWYDLIIFGDVIEHMDIVKAQRVIEYARGRCTDMIVAVPFQYIQGELYGNEHERHIQDDLTEEVMAERYPCLKLFFKPRKDYGFYHLGPP